MAADNPPGRWTIQPISPATHPGPGRRDTLARFSAEILEIATPSPDIARIWAAQIASACQYLEALYG
jgi:hypothetical protein